MKVDKTTPTKEITVQGFPLVTPQPYAAGHPLTETEAAVLNQTLAENLRNNFGSQIRKSKEETEAEGKKYEPDLAKLQKAFNDYVAEYEFGVKRTGGGVTLDPVERKGRALAADVVKRAIQNKGVKLKDVGNDKIKELADEYYKTNETQILEQARALIAADERASKAMAAVSVDL